MSDLDREFLEILKTATQADKQLLAELIRTELWRAQQEAKNDPTRSLLELQTNA